MKDVLKFLLDEIRKTKDLDKELEETLSYHKDTIKETEKRIKENEIKRVHFEIAVAKLKENQDGKF